MTHEEYQRRRRELQNADSFDNPTYNKAVDLDGEYLRSIKLPEMPEVKFDGACQICHGDHTKCDGKCIPEIRLPCLKHEWIYDDKNGGYCDVCGKAYKTPEQIATLKAQWESDPNWDIETTEGFEAYSYELWSYRQKKEAEWKQARQAKLLAKAEELGVPGNIKLAEKFMLLESRIENLTALVNTAHEVLNSLPPLHTH